MRLLRWVTLSSLLLGLIGSTPWPLLAVVALTVAGVTGTALAQYSVAAAADSPFVAIWWRLARRWALVTALSLSVAMGGPTATTAAAVAIGTTGALALLYWIRVGNTQVPEIPLPPWKPRAPQPPRGAAPRPAPDSSSEQDPTAVIARPPQAPLS